MAAYLETPRSVFVSFFFAARVCSLCSLVTESVVSYFFFCFLFCVSVGKSGFDGLYEHQRSSDVCVAAAQGGTLRVDICALRVCTLSGAGTMKEHQLVTSTVITKKKKTLYCLRTWRSRRRALKCDVKRNVLPSTSSPCVGTSRRCSACRLGTAVMRCRRVSVM